MIKIESFTLFRLEIKALLIIKSWTHIDLLSIRTKHITWYAKMMQIKLRQMRMWLWINIIIMLNVLKKLKNHLISLIIFLPCIHIRICILILLLINHSKYLLQQSISLLIIHIIVIYKLLVIRNTIIIHSKKII